MPRRRAMVAIGLASAAATPLVVAPPAHAEPRTITVTLLGGVQIPVTVDVPPGTPLDQIRIPGLQGPIIGISDSGPVATPSPVPPAPVAPVPSSPLPGQSGGLPDAPRSDETSGERRGKGQRTVRREPRGADVMTEELAASAVAAAEKAAARAKREAQRLAGRTLGGVPTSDNPAFTLAVPGAAPIGVPNFMIDRFRIPPFLLPIYQAAGIEYGIRWEVLAAINEIETDYGRNLNVSSAGALGWMQFIPSTWKTYGVDANRDGAKDPYNPVDAIFAAARYLKAAGAEKDLRRAIFAYNHADWYVDSVVMRARLIGGLPANFVGSLTGLTQAQFPVRATARYADDISEAEAARRIKRGRNAAFLVNADRRRRGINIYARPGSPVVAVNEGRVVRIGKSKRLGRFIQLQDVYGNTFTYGHLKKIAATYLAPRHKFVSRAAVRRELKLPAPKAPASAGRQTRKRAAFGRAGCEASAAAGALAAGAGSTSRCSSSWRRAIRSPTASPVSPRPRMPGRSAGPTRSRSACGRGRV